MLILVILADEMSLSDNILLKISHEQEKIKQNPESLKLEEIERLKEVLK